MKFKKIFVIFFIFLLLIPSFCHANSGIVTYGLEDISGVQSYLENKIVEKTGISASNFAKDGSYCYFIFFDEATGFYHVLISKGFRYGYFNRSYPMFYVSSLSNFDICIKPRYNSISFSYFTFDTDMNSSDIINYSSGNIVDSTLNKLFNVTIFNYCNLHFASESIASGIAEYYYSIFSNRASVYFPTTDVSDSDMGNIEYYDIAPCDFYSNVFINDATSLKEGCQSFVLKLYYEENEDSNSMIEQVTLNLGSSYWFADDFIFRIPISVLKLMCHTKGSGSYHTSLYFSFSNYEYVLNSFEYDATTDSIIATLPDIPDDPNQGIKDMTNTISAGLNEVNETNKGIWETIKNILNFINPFSEEFFVYKLIELLLDMLKSLFIPSDDFFINWLDDLNAYFGDVFGILYYPLELLIDFLNRINTINSTEPIMNIPSFNIDFMGYQATFFSGFTYNFNDLLINDTFKNIHTIYLGIVDVILWLSVVYLASKCIKSIVGGISDEAVDNATSSERSYKEYEQYQNNKQRYKDEHK